LPQQIADAIEFSLTVEAQLALNQQNSLQDKVYLARKEILQHLASTTSGSNREVMLAYTNGGFVLTGDALRHTPKQIVTRPITNPGRPTVNPLLLRLSVIVVAVNIVTETVQAGHNAYNAKKSVELLFKLYEALDAASLSIDFDYFEDWRVREPIPGDREMLDQLRALYEAGQLMHEDDLNLYFWLLCNLEDDCKGLDLVKYERHHIIPKERADHPLVVAALKCADKFYFNGEDNLITLEKYSKDTGQGRHGNHPDYNDWVQELLDQLRRNYIIRYGDGPFDPCISKDLIIELIDETLRPAINEDPKEKINDLGKRKLGR
jgi:hypothetical protein